MRKIPPSNSALQIATAMSSRLTAQVMLPNHQNTRPTSPCLRNMHCRRSPHRRVRKSHSDDAGPTDDHAEAADREEDRRKGAKGNDAVMPQARSQA